MVLGTACLILMVNGQGQQLRPGRGEGLVTVLGKPLRSVETQAEGEWN